jgi:hypothetical protein
MSYQDKKNIFYNCKYCNCEVVKHNKKQHERTTKHKENINNDEIRAKEEIIKNYSLEELNKMIEMNKIFKLIKNA